MKEETGLCIKREDITYGERGFEWVLGEEENGEGAKNEDVKGEDAKGENVTSGLVKVEHVKHGPETEVALELNFMIKSEEPPEEVKLDPEEHLESLWAGEKDIVGLKMTPEMRGVVENAFAVLKFRRRVRWANLIVDGSVLPLSPGDLKK